jgi:tRNA pseudouridine38-40 synthase
MPRYRLLVAYEGTEFVGWQRQAAGTSIQALLEDALSKFEEGPVTVLGAGRTDAGVHALGQVAACTLTRAFAPDVIVRALNVRLPPSVRVLRADEVADDFHPQFAAKSKTYRYRIWNADVLDPFERLFAWHVYGPLDVDAMNEAARMLEGTHDFAAFQGTGSEVKTTERTVYESAIARSAIANLITYEVTGNGFLRHMVRAIVGTLVEIGRGRRSPAWMRDVLESRNRSAAGATAPAAGLFLVRVDY